MDLDAREVLEAAEREVELQRLLRDVVAEREQERFEAVAEVAQGLLRLGVVVAHTLGRSALAVAVFGEAEPFPCVELVVVFTSSSTRNPSS